MKKVYFEPETEWIPFSEDDIIKTSGEEKSSGEFDPEDVTPAW